MTGQRTRRMWRIAWDDQGDAWWTGRGWSPKEHRARVYFTYWWAAKTAARLHELNPWTSIRIEEAI